MLIKNQIEEWTVDLKKDFQVKKKGLWADQLEASH